MKRLRLLSLFSGIGAFEKALTNIGVDYELVNFCEFDKYAVKSYCAIHNVDESINLGDITKVDLDSLPNSIDVLTHGSPCQNYSRAGKRDGGDKGSGTKSSLMWNSVEIIKKVKPNYVIWENVSGVLEPKNIHNFNQYIEDLDEIGYVSSWKVLNSCDFGIPQNRERIFCISILNGVKFEFPNPPYIPCKLRDVIDLIVDEKYYINEEFSPVEVKNNDSVCRRLGSVALNGHDYLKRVYDIEKCSPTLPTGTGGNHEPKILIIDDLYKNRDVRVYEDSCPTLRSGRFGLKVTDGYRVRKITPKEYWRLQAFLDEDFNKCVSIGMSDTQLKKQAGNSITVRVLEYILKELFKEYIEIK